jgi:hypothetical protein
MKKACFFCLPIRVTTSETALKNKQETLHSEQGALKSLQVTAAELAEQNPQGQVVQSTNLGYSMIFSVLLQITSLY